MKLDAKTLSYLVLPPMMWAGNTVVGRVLVDHVPPVLMNTLRWALVAAILAPWGWRVLRDQAALRQRLPYLALIGALGVGSYNALQYLALQTSSPINVTLIGASMPMWMMLVGALGFGQAFTARQALGALLCMSGVVLVMAQGRWEVLRQVHLVPGDLLMLLASLVWALYSWLLARPPSSMTRGPTWDWAGFLWLQVLFGLLWAVACSGVEASWRAEAVSWPQGPAAWWTTLGGLLFIALGPSIVAYRGWGLGVQAVGPTVAAFFGNLIPVFAALWSWLLLGQTPRWYHPCALLLIATGIAWSSRTTARPSGQA
ncbi:MAG TPA: DMT family transporter [Aquabacterium sp.]|uniref:DMT family transporter n=1 Tax=Aquabacterium sp. TaxID=1872578 RepID=UPI002E2EE5CA|nr:DMT family transporter [Aquabacterium sp.]HEX5373313.1 DMT family transporter [Aquabacterium sp.]